MTVPVPLTDIEARPMTCQVQGRRIILGVGSDERDALCAALRIAVNTLHQTLACGCCCYGKEHDDGCHEPLIDSALAAVRELVDL